MTSNLFNIQKDNLWAPQEFIVDILLGLKGMRLYFWNVA
jgi:hypothetical protein